jgi:hypothetical protein
MVNSAMEFHSRVDHTVHSLIVWTITVVVLSVVRHALTHASLSLSLSLSLSTVPNLPALRQGPHYFIRAQKYLRLSGEWKEGRKEGISHFSHTRGLGLVSVWVCRWVCVGCYYRK